VATLTEIAREATTSVIAQTKIEAATTAPISRDLPARKARWGDTDPLQEQRTNIPSRQAGEYTRPAVTKSTGSGGLEIGESSSRGRVLMEPEGRNQNSETRNVNSERSFPAFDFGPAIIDGPLLACHVFTWPLALWRAASL
jgi:hypothetical protein